MSLVQPGKIRGDLVTSPRLPFERALALLGRLPPTLAGPSDSCGRIAQEGGSRPGSSVVVLCPLSRLDPVNRTFLLCPNRTFSFCCANLIPLISTAHARRIGHD